MVKEALLHSSPRTLLLSKKLAGTGTGKSLEEIAGRRSVEVITLADGCYQKISGLKNPEGAAVIITWQTTPLTKILTREARLIVASGIQNPGNAGAVIRVAEAAGASGCIFLNGVDLTHPGFLRAAAGSAFRLPCASAEHSVFLAAAQKHSIRILAATNSNDYLPYNKAVYKPPMAVCIGSEGAGLPDDILQVADCRIFIPMQRPVESLNAAVAAGIILYQARIEWPATN